MIWNKLIRMMVFAIASLWCIPGTAQNINGNGDAWQEVFAHKKGKVIALWDDIEPFIYLNREGRLEGVEYEIMESFKPYLKNKYGIELTIQWQQAGSFTNIYNKVKSTGMKGVFGWSYYSITPERQKEVQFSAPYMPDLNVLVTNNREPTYATSQEFTVKLKEMNAYTQLNTTMEEDVNSLKENFYPPLAVKKAGLDYDVLRMVAGDNNGFGYVPLSIYIVALQKGIKVKRQNVLSNRREGFAAVMPLHSDWKPIIDEYMMSEDFRLLTGSIVARYLGSEVKDLVFGPAGLKTASTTLHNLDLVSLEKEIVTKRLMDTALEVQRHQSLRNIMLVVLFFVIILTSVLYSRFRTKQKLNRQLQEHNQQISRQRDQIEKMNRMLKLKVLQARMNPHFIFNSLNSIQYFITGDDKKNSLQYISRFSAFLRKVINYGDELSIPVHEEAELLRQYLWLEQSRFQGRFEYEITVHSSAHQAVILPLLSLGMAEEALYKGVLNLPPALKGYLNFEFYVEEKQLKILVTDNGMARSQSMILDKKKGLLNGQENMLTGRIEMYNTQNGKKITRTIQEAERVGDDNISSLEIPQPLFDQT
jgi:ABC-type amino acid transport substrate-binding protein